MARLTAAERRHLKPSEFAGPDGSFPIEDEGHAKAAKSMASRYASPAVKAQVDRRVKARYGFADGGKAETTSEFMERIGHKDGGAVKKDSENEKEAEGSAAEEAGESKAEERAEKKAGKDRKGHADGGIARASSVLNLKPTPGGDVPKSDGGHRISAGMRSSLKGYKNI